MVEKSVSATTSGNTVVAKLRTLAPGEVVSGGYFKGFERTDEYVQMISRDGKAFAGHCYIYGDDPGYHFVFTDFSGNVVKTVVDTKDISFPCDINYSGSIALYSFEVLE